MIHTGRLGLPMLDTVHHARAEDLLAALPDNSVDLIATDPPYYRVKNCAWDRQWDTAEGFITWLGGLCEQWRRVLKPNGSLYVFASPRMAARVEVEVGRWFNVLNQLVWAKPSSRHNQACKETIRGFFPQTERVIFAEHYGADNAAKGEAGYGQACDELRGFTFEPIRSYLDDERRRAGVAHRAVIAHLGMTGHDSHFFSPVQWKLPLEHQYHAMRELFNTLGPSPNGSGAYLRREYEDLRREYEDLRREYEGLRREYEDLRRPFSVSADVPYTDVWTFPTVGYYAGKHPAEKPAAMMEHIVSASSRPGAVVLDTFAGSGTTLAAAKALGRHWLGCDMSEHWAAYANARIEGRAGSTLTEQLEAAQAELLPESVA